MVGKSKINYHFIRGDGLGKKRDGIKECIQITKRYENEGLGKTYKKMNDVWWEDSFNNVLKNISFKNDKEGIPSRTRSRSVSMTENEYFKSENNKKESKIKNDKNSINNSHSNKNDDCFNERKIKKDNKKKFNVEVKNNKVKVIHFSDDEED